MQLLQEKRMKKSREKDLDALFCWSKSFEKISKNTRYSEFFLEMHGEYRRRIGHLRSSKLSRYIDETIIDEMNSNEEKLRENYQYYHDSSCNSEIEYSIWVFPHPLKYNDIADFFDFSDGIFVPAIMLIWISLFVILVPLQILLAPIFYILFTSKFKKLALIEENAKKKYDVSFRLTYNRILEHRANGLIKYKYEDCDSFRSIEKERYEDKITSYEIIKEKNDLDRYNDETSKKFQRLHEIMENEPQKLMGLMRVFEKVDDGSRLKLHKSYREYQSNIPFVSEFKDTLNKLKKECEKHIGDSVSFILIPILFAYTDYKIVQKEKDRVNIIELQSYLMFNWYDYNNIKLFDKILEIFLSISKGKRARGFWWKGSIPSDNIFFQLLLLLGDLLTDSNLIDSYFTSESKLIDTNSSLVIKELIFDKLVPIFDEYAKILL